MFQCLFGIYIAVLDKVFVEGGGGGGGRGGFSSIDFVSSTEVRINARETELEYSGLPLHFGCTV